MGEKAQRRPARLRKGSQHVLRFSGKAVDARRAPFLRDVLDLLVDGAQQATRLQVDGRSTAPGTTPGWLDAVVGFEIANIDDREIVLRVPSLVEAAPQRFRQLDLFEAGASMRSSLDYFEDRLEDALAGRADSDRFDGPLMSTFESFGRLFCHGVASIEIVNGRTLRVDAASIDAIRMLERRTPADQRAMVAGKLDAIRHSDRAFSLLLESGEVVRGLVVADHITTGALAALFGRPALVAGHAKFRPSGSVLRIEADHIAEASTADLGVFSAVPAPVLGAVEPRDLRKQPGLGLAAVVGEWPGDETDEEVRAALGDLS